MEYVERVFPAAEARQRRPPVALRERGRPLVEPRGDEQQRGQRDRDELEPVLESLHDSDGAHAARGDGDADDHGNDDRAHPLRSAGERVQRDAGALELWQEVEPADEDDEHR